jgi:hypothetical protein
MRLPHALHGFDTSNCPIFILFYKRREQNLLVSLTKKAGLTFFEMKKKIMFVSFGAGLSPAFGTWFIPYLNDSSVLSEARLDHMEQF